MFWQLLLFVRINALIFKAVIGVELKAAMVVLSVAAGVP